VGEICLCSPPTFWGKYLEKAECVAGKPKIKRYYSEPNSRGMHTNVA
jgi:hypothetical protein